MGRGEAISNERGFTLLELIITLLVIALAVGLTVPAIGRSTETALASPASVASRRVTATPARSRRRASRREWASASAGAKSPSTTVG
jgi:prepilin-type N-terminal cleavage/methylation domain-containing protein